MNPTQLKILNQNSITTISLNRPHKRNALNDTLVKELTDVLLYYGKNGNTKAIILTGEGDAFCSGADLEYLQKISKYSLEDNQEDSRLLMRLYQSIYELRKPVIAMVNGPALAGGCGLATVCDFVIASNQKAKFGYPEVKIGFIPAIVMVFLVKRIGEGKARELVMSGKIISADEAKNIGLINVTVSSEKLLETTLSFATELIEQNSNVAMGLCKEMFSSFGQMDTKQALEYAANMNAFTRMTEDCKRGIESFLKKEKINWK